MKTEQPLLITSVVAAEDFSSTKNIFIGFDGRTCGNGAKAFGVLNAETAQDEYAPLMSKGSALVLSGGPVSVGTRIQSDGNGKAITFASGEVNGYAIDSSTGADELIRVLLI